ncbi:PREDICTED: protein hook homolog [Polistes canadensis]|uniref:protein hook homolog n=1 Tax=Polistes canadensis TaxID=91411 RepID=UPI000718AFAF|nr:PREDICTED: protein hook homolog [Polistes canadensis]
MTKNNERKQSRSPVRREFHSQNNYKKKEAMPEITLFSASNSPILHALASASKENNPSGSSITVNLKQCVRHKLQYSQLPIRCQRTSPYYRPVRSPFKLVGLSAINHNNVSFVTSKNCPDSSHTNSTCSSPILRAIGPSRCKKSLSMTDLSPTAIDSETVDFRSESNSSLGLREDQGERNKDSVGTGNTLLRIGHRTWTNNFLSTNIEVDGNCFSQNPGKAASIVCHVLVLNAWRRRRVDVGHLQETIDELTRQIDHLRLQIVVLRRLLDTENDRVNRLSKEAQRSKTQIEELSQERDVLKKEKDKLEEEVKRLEDTSEERSVTTENLRNELLNAQNQLQALDGQIARDREKLLKLREDKRILLDKISASEALATERGTRADRAESAIEDLQIRLAAQIALVESAQEQNQRYAKQLKDTEDQRMILEKQLRLNIEAGKALSLRTNILESQLADKEAALHRIESIYNSQLMELNGLKERLIRQSQEGGWSSRVLQIAGSVVRAPRAILRTLSFLSSTTVPS